MTPALASAAEPADEQAGDEDSKAEAEASVSVGSKGSKASGKSKGKKKGGGSKLAESAAMKGRWALGAQRTVSGLNGLFVRGYVANRWTLGMHLGVATFSHRDVDEDGEFGRIRTIGVVGLGPEVFFWPVQGDRTQQVHADFGIGFRGTGYVGFLGRLEEERGDTLDIPVEIDLEVPAAIQLFIGRRVAILPEFGVVFRIIPGSREPDQNGEFDENPGTGIGSRLERRIGAEDPQNGPGLGFELGDHAGLFMGIGVAYYFGKLDE